jgi:hypothetical protein
MTNTNTASAKATKAVEAFMKIDTARYDYPSELLIKHIKERLQPLLNELDIHVEPNEDVDEDGVLTRARDLALVLIELAYCQPGALPEREWYSVGDALGGCLRFALPSAGEPNLDPLIHSLYSRLSAFCQSLGDAGRVLRLLWEIHSEDCELGDDPSSWPEWEGGSAPPSDPVVLGVEARSLARQLARALVARGNATSDEAWLAEELIPLLTMLPVAVPEL